jgi:hypothetical protein
MAAIFTPTTGHMRMTRKEYTLKRLDEIAHALQATGDGVALIGVGSCGAELERMDDWSDLDFFAIVRPGKKQQYIDNPDWLSVPAPVAFVFMNTHDGFKLLYADGVFCEMAVFEPDDMKTIPFAAPRVIWSAPEFDPAWAVPHVFGDASRPPLDVNHSLGEALTNLYVGLQRFHRGEKLSALQFVQSYAVRQVMLLAEQREQPLNGWRDPWVVERRIETRYPALAAELPAMMQGYERTPESAAAILAHLEAHYPVNAALAAAIRGLV